MKMGCLFSCCGSCNFCCHDNLNKNLPSPYFDISANKLPIIYSREYNISFCGLENLHPFDSKKWGRVYNILEENGLVTADRIVEPNQARTEDLLLVHSQRYLTSLKVSCTLAAITEVLPVCCMPPSFTERHLLRPFRYHTGGTILAAKLAMERGWAINIGGGFHHCSADHGGGFCVYADITLAIHFVFSNCTKARNAMIVDLDAHQGNGHEKDFLGDNRVYILDVYNSRIYPRDMIAKKAIRRNVELLAYTEDELYMLTVTRNLEQALFEFQPDFVLYNAGTDILEGDPLGALSISEDGIVMRDETVFRIFRSRNIPIAMVTSGGYQRRTAQVIARSIMNLNEKQLINCEL